LGALNVNEFTKNLQSGWNIEQFRNKTANIRFLKEI